MGKTSPQLGSGHVQGTLGPLSTSLEGVKLFMKTVLAAKPWVTDPSLIPMPWRDDESYFQRGGHKKIKVAILWCDAVVKPHPPITRALKEVVKKLKEVRGIEVVDWKPYKHDFAWELIVSSTIYWFTRIDTLKSFVDACEGKPLLCGWGRSNYGIDRIFW